MAIVSRKQFKQTVGNFVTGGTKAIADYTNEIRSLAKPGPQPGPGGSYIRGGGGGYAAPDMAQLNQRVIDEFNRLRERYQQTYNARYGNIVNTGNETQAGLKNIAQDYKTQGEQATAGIGKSYDQAMQQYADSLKGVRGDLAAQGASTGALDAQQAQQGNVLTEQATRQKALGDRLNQVTNSTFGAQQGDALTQFGGYKSQLENQLADRLFTLDENQRAALAELAAAVSGGGGGGGGGGRGGGGGGGSDGYGNLTDTSYEQQQATDTEKTGAVDYMGVVSQYMGASKNSQTVADDLVRRLEGGASPQVLIGMLRDSRKKADKVKAKLGFAVTPYINALKQIQKKQATYGLNRYQSTNQAKTQTKSASFFRRKT